MMYNYKERVRTRSWLAFAEPELERDAHLG